MSEIELKACPFCGGRDIRDFGGLAWSRIPQCRGCGARAMGPFSEGKRNPVDVWNTRASQWQPIESAPKDGTRLMLWDSRAGGYAVTGAWVAGSADDHETITHWQPLPAPPEGEG